MRLVVFHPPLHMADPILWIRSIRVISRTLCRQCRIFSITYIVVFPTLFSDILCRGIQDASVRHSVLSIASFLADYRLNRSTGRFELNYILQVIQRSIAEVRVDESLAIAVFLIAWIDAARGQYEVCRKHLRGLSLILERVQPICQNPTASRDRISPLIMLIWRFATRMDCSVGFFAFHQPVFPMMPSAEDLHGNGSVKSALRTRH